MMPPVWTMRQVAFLKAPSKNDNFVPEKKKNEAFVFQEQSKPPHLEKEKTKRNLV